MTAGPITRNGMPRNNLGGNRAKKLGNKHGGRTASGGGGQYAGVRRAGEGEVYAVASKVCGGGRAIVTGNDGITRRVEIRGKFRGRNRRHNEVKAGGLVLVGDRLWALNESTHQAKERVCDLLYVYSTEELRTLQREGLLNTTALKRACEKFDINDDEDGIAFDGAMTGSAGLPIVDQGTLDEQYDPYAGMPSFTDDEDEDNEIAPPVDASEDTSANAAEAAENRPETLFDDDEEVDEDDI